MTIPRIEGFDITAWVRETSTGVIWSATQRSLQRPVLLHFLRPGVSDDVRAAFERNARLVASINVPGLVGIYDVAAATDGTPCAVLEAFDGQSLLDTLKTEGPFPQKRLISVARSVATTLDAAWKSHRYVHRNLKPEEMFLLPDGSIRLTGFVSAARSGKDGILEDHSGDVVGTPAFMPPEQAEARPTLDTRADMYALGAILHYLATGHIPFESLASDPVRLLQELPTATLPSPRDFGAAVTPAFEAVLGRLLMKDPQDRYGSWGGLLQDLDSLAANKPPAIAKAFVPVGAPTLAPPAARAATLPTAVPVTPTGPAASGGGSELDALRRESDARTPAYQKILWLLLVVGVAAFGAWRWNHPDVTFEEVRSSITARFASGEKPADIAPTSDTPMVPITELTTGTTPQADAATQDPSVLSGNDEVAPEVPDVSEFADEYVPDSQNAPTSSAPAPVEYSTTVAPPVSSVATAEPTAVSPETAFLRSFLTAIRAASLDNARSALRKWNETNPEEATAAVRTLQDCGWPHDRLGSRIAEARGRKLSFRYNGQDVDIEPERYVAGRLAATFVRKDGTRKEVEFPLSNLDAATRWALYRQCAPIGDSAETEEHAATALYALEAGDVAAFSRECPLAGGLEPVLRRIQDALARRAAGSSPAP